jgi:hypothetical protein
MMGRSSIVRAALSKGLPQRTLESIEMKASGLIVIAMVGLLAGFSVHAQQSAAPTGSTGQCKDGSYTSTATKRGACKGHTGVKEWYTAASPAAPAAAPMAKPTAASPMAPAATGGMTSKKGMPAPAANAAPGGGPGMVWVNSSSKVYHCPSDKWYGKTKQGEYMTEADAKAKGNHAEHGKTCTP